MIDEFQSPVINEISKAMSDFQLNMPILEKTGANFTKGKAADMGDIVTVARTCSKYGLSFSQAQVSIVRDGTKTESFVQTFVRHVSGQWISGGLMPVLPEKAGAANYGAALTYAKKYSLQSVFGIADYNETDIDDELSLSLDDELSPRLSSGHSGEGNEGGATASSQGEPQVAPPSPLERIEAAKNMDDIQALWSAPDINTDDPAIFNAFDKKVSEINNAVKE